MQPDVVGTALPLLDDPCPRATGSLGALRVKDGDALSLLPLTAVRIAARVTERIADLTMIQTFRNAHDTPLEAVYIFPLPGEAAVRDFLLRVGNRVLRGAVQERGEARRQYQQALEEGRRAALLEQERDDVFTVQVGNLPPGEEVTVELSYARQLPFFEDGTTEIRLPMLVAPRYIPGVPLDRPQVGDGVERDTDVVPDASRITPPRLARDQRPAISLHVDVELVATSGDGGSVIADLTCSQHATRVRTEGGATIISLAREDEALDRDFVLRWRLAGATTQSTLLIHRDDDGLAYGVVSLVPPRQDGFLGVPRDIVFVVDRSGSMQGVKMASAARACSLLLATLGPRDRFAIAAFDNTVEWLEAADEPGGERRRLQHADQRGLEQGEQFLRRIDARGGTELYEALGAAFSALSGRSDGTGRAPVVVLLTDGQVGDEARVLQRLQAELGEARVFTVGIDTAVNEAFLSRLAALGGGTATFVQPGAPLVDALKQVGREIGVPVVTNLALEVLDRPADTVELARPSLPDLMAGRAITAFLRARSGNGTSAPLRLRVRGQAADGKPADILLKEQPVAMTALAQLWARERVRELEDRFRAEPASQDALRKEIVALAVHHHLLTRFTAFVVVDEEDVVNADGSRQRVVQPVAIPGRWDMPVQTTGGGPAGVAYALAAAPMSPPPAAPIPTGAFPSASLQMRHASAPPPASAHGGVSSNLLKRMEDGIRGLRRKAPAERPTMREPEPPATPQAEQPRGREAVAAALRRYAEAFDATRQALAEGRLPTADALDAARSALLKALAASDIGADCPLLQRFLRSTAVELSAALRAPGTQVGTVLALFDKHRAAFETARAETARHAGAAKKSRPFWESGV